MISTSAINTYHQIVSKLLELYHAAEQAQEYIENIQVVFEDRLNPIVGSAEISQVISFVMHA